jgi:type IV pilus assembly protein PilM
LVKFSRKMLCLDWDHRSLRLVVAKIAGGRAELEDAHSHRIPSTVDPDNPDALGQFIQQMMRRHRWSQKRVVVHIPRDRAVINRLLLPPTPDHELAAAVRFQAMKELPFPLEDAVIDYVIKRRDETGLAVEVLLAAVTQDVLGGVQATCEAAGLEPLRIGLRPYANLISIKHLAGLAEKRVLFVDVGPRMTEIDVMDNGTLAFARAANVTTPMSGDSATEDSRITTFADVADMAASDQAVETAVNELGVEVTRTLQAYRASEPDAVIHEIVVAGGSGVEPHLLTALGKRFGVRTALFDPTEALGVSPDEAAKLRSFSAALGLAWGLSEAGAFELDFLNPKKPIPPRQALKRRLRIGGMAVGAVVVAALTIYLMLYYRAYQEYDRQQGVVSNLRKELANYMKVKNSVEEVEDWRVGAVWPEHMLQLTDNAVSPGKEMLVQQLALDSRTASATIKKMETTRWQVATEFATKLNELTGPGGQRLYKATQGGSRTLKLRDSNFTRAVDIEVELLDLKNHLKTQEERTRARRREMLP